MDLEELRGFLAVADSGSFLAAATELGVPRGTLRRRIDALEARAGVSLLERSARGVTLTEAGATLVERGRKLLDEGAALLAAVRQSARPSPAPLRLRVPVGLPPELLVRFVELTRALSPGRRFEVKICDDPLAQLDAEVDLALVLGAGAPASGWLIRELLRAPVRVIGSEAYLARHGRPRAPEQLGEHALAAWAGPQIDPRAWPLRADPNARIEVDPKLISNDIHALHGLACAGLGLVLVPDPPLALLPAAEAELHTVLADQVGCELPVQLAIAEATAEREHIERAAALIAELSRAVAPAPAKTPP